MENLRWANTESSMHNRETNRDPSMHLGRPIRICPCILERPIQKFCSHLNSQLYSQFHFQVKFCFTASFNPNITTNLLHHNEYNVICLSSNSKLSPLYYLCFVHIFLFCSKVTSLQFPGNGTCRKRPTL